MMGPAIRVCAGGRSKLNSGIVLDGSVRKKNRLTLRKVAVLLKLFPYITTTSFQATSRSGFKKCMLPVNLE